MKSIGICVGASTLSSVALIRERDGRIRTEDLHIVPHHGNPRAALVQYIRTLPRGNGLHIAVTGRKFRQLLNLPSLSEPEAVETALAHLHGKNGAVHAVVSAGGETFMVYLLGENGRITAVRTGNKCASGTGEFYVQQLRRIGLTIEEAEAFAREEEPYLVSGRCSVFCKSDCTHAANKGIPKGRIAAGLSKMMAGKILEILKPFDGNHILLVGGAARNARMVDYLREEMDDCHWSVPKEAPYFEALGSALWALDQEATALPEPENLFRANVGAFQRLSPLIDYESGVDFRSTPPGKAREGDRTVLGLDVGSTTTKAVLLRLEDHRILASVYLRTNGNPVEASRACYRALSEQLRDLTGKVSIIGLGVTGSGRQIAGLHAMTDGVINEIVAHAAGALFYDPEVDTIFEIGGQDAKYTFIKDGVPSDYAMNDACSAGTGSFLEEAAKESMGMDMHDIGPLAMQGAAPPNFNDQCAAFISSDIKNAFHENIPQSDVTAGLIYSVCMNYNHRVKGARPVGNRIFMQGGVCYNRAVPIAMSALTGKRIIVPPDPGLIGAFGVALEVERLVALGLMEEKSFHIETLAARELSYESPFVCNGGKEKCDRKCTVARIKIEGKIYPFGGICNRWYNLRVRRERSSETPNLSALHERLVFRQEGPGKVTERMADRAPTVGLNNAFMVNTYYPLYSEFFRRLGFRVALPDQALQEGIERKRAPFCYPAEAAHGYFAALLDEKPDFLFLPHVQGVSAGPETDPSTVCPLSQGEPYYLSTSFKDHPHLAKLEKERRVLRPVLDFSRGIESASGAMTGLAAALGRTRKEARNAFAQAARLQEQTHRAIEDMGRRLLEQLAVENDRFAIVVFGRTYNACASRLNMGIPDKFASRGVPVLPVDCLPLEGQSAPADMYWSTGQTILKGASFVKGNDRLFGCYITNFSCGPDSFLLTYFRQTMGDKPFLILELDSHVADAGLETRIEAFLDIVGNYRKLMALGRLRQPASNRVQTACYDGKDGTFVDSDGNRLPLTDPRVHLVFPSMAPLLLDLTSAVFRSQGIRAEALPPADEETLKLGQGHTSGKECLPLQLTVGSLMQYLRNRTDKDERLLYFMPTASGPCRFGQYAPFIERLVAGLSLENVALLSLQSENGYAGLGGTEFTLRVWSAMIVSDIMADVRSVLLANATDRNKALEIHERQIDLLRQTFEAGGDLGRVSKTLEKVALNLRTIPVRRTLEETPRILLTGEIFVRHDGLSRQWLVEKIAEHGFAVKVSSVMEWVYYTDWCFLNGFNARTPDLSEKLRLRMRASWMKKYEKTYKAIVARSGLLPFHMEDLEHVIATAGRHINPALTGEAVLTVGAALNDIVDQYCGVIAIGPFGCMPNRLAESILSREMNRPDLTRGSSRPRMEALPSSVRELPFLAIESDGKLFPQVINARLEVFLLQAGRLFSMLPEAAYSLRGREGRGAVS